MPLDGVKVLDLTQVVAGPFCTTLLADMGAEVVKVERPSGDDLRRLGSYEGREGHQDYFNANNRSKKSVVLDLKQADDRSLALDLAARAGVLVENFAPGTADRLGLGWDAVRTVNPRVIYCSLSGFGQTGPYSNRLALDPIVQAISGLMSVTGAPDGPPMMVGAPVADVVAGLYAAYAIVNTLMLVRRDGRGRSIDISMQAATMAALGPRMAQSMQAGQVPQRMGNENMFRVPSNCFRAKDGAYVSMMVTHDKHWAPFCRALQRPAWIEDPRFVNRKARAAHRSLLNEMVGARVGEEPADHWTRCLARERVPVARVNTYLDAIDDPQVAHRGLVREVEHATSGAIRMVGPPWVISDLATPIASPPLLGQHTQEVLRNWLGRDAEGKSG